MPTEYLNETPFQLAPVPGRVGYPGHSLSLVVKGTFTLVQGDKARLGKEQDEFAGDQPYDDDESGEAAPRYEADLVAPLKPRTDFLVVGSCHTPGQQPLRQCEVAAKVGAHVHHLQVHGDRQWLPDGRASQAQTFTVMPLRYERSYGGAGFPENPSGIGFAPGPGPDGRVVHRLANLEDARTPIARPNAHVFPAGFGPLPRTWRLRSSKMGTYDERYVKMRWPGLPQDFDWTHFNAAHPAMQIEPHVQGDEPLEFLNLHPQHPTFRTQLPGMRVRAFVDVPIEGSNVIALRELAMKLDTVWVDVEAEKLLLLWRGVTQVSSAKYPEVRRVYVTSEDMAGPSRTAGAYELLLSRALAERALAESPSEGRLAALAAAMGGGFGSTAALPTQAPAASEAAAADEPDPDDPALEAQLAELEAAMGGFAGSIPAETPEDAEPDPEPAPPTPEERAAQAKVSAQNGESLAGEDLTGLDFSGFDFAGANLAGALLMNANLRGAKLDGCNLEGASLANADLAKASAVGATFSEAQMPGAKLSGAYLGQCLFRDVNASACDLTGANLEGANLERAVFAEANLEGANLAGARLVKTNLVGAKAAKANFSGADLTEAVLESCEAPEARFSDVKAARVRASEADLSGSVWQKCEAPEAVFTAAKLDGANFTASRLPGATFAQASLLGALALGADLKQARFEEANLSRANLSQANLFEGLFEAARLERTSFRASNVYGAEFLDAVIEGTDFTGANVKRTKLEGKVRT